MQRHGFAPIAKEWWHFTLRAEPFSTARFDFLVR
jgi:zinc D-Ala-D-Ala dipeptidase